MFREFFLSGSSALCGGKKYMILRLVLMFVAFVGYNAVGSILLRARASKVML